MNKKIKIYDLINRIHENKDVPKIIKYEDEKYQYKEDVQDYKKVSDYYIYLFETIIKEEKWLDVEVEILEDEEETGISKLEKEKVLEENPAEFRYDLRYYYDKEKMGDKINEIIKKVNELEKKINKED